MYPLTHQAASGFMEHGQRLRTLDLFYSMDNKKKLGQVIKIF